MSPDRLGARAARLLPFLSWMGELRDPRVLRADLLAGITVALVLIPQSMAYAQLAGLPAYYGLYAAFLPGVVAALWGSSRHLATGPVAVVSLLTASTLAPLAATGSESFITLAILLALLVGLVQLLLGLFRLGVVVNFLSHPVILGFTNAAALIIGLSQLNKVLGVSMGRSDSFLRDIWEVLLQLPNTHLPTLLMGATALALLILMRRFVPKVPGVLLVVVLATLVSWATGFERNGFARLEDLADPELRTLAEETLGRQQRAAQLAEQLSAQTAALNALEASDGDPQQRAALRFEVELLTLRAGDAEKELRNGMRALRRFALVRVPGSGDTAERYYFPAQLPAGVQSDGHRWRIRKIDERGLTLSGGGLVVGAIPAGLPSLSLPRFSLDQLGSLLAGALVISLVGFMEAISIAKAMAAKTRHRLDPNQELIGQGLANIVGGLTQSYPVSGSFSRSAVNLNAGAASGMSAVFAGLVVLITLLFLTPLLYHLPQAVLAAIIITAVLGLINVKGVLHAWRAQPQDGVAAAVTFVATLAFAPKLDLGILTGAGLAIGLYLYRTMRPRVALLGRADDGTLRDVRVFPLPVGGEVLALRFDGQLYFANVAYFEDAVLEAIAAHPEARYLVVVGDGINQLDASGEEVLHHLVERLSAGGVQVVLSGFKRQVLQVLRRTGLAPLVGEANIHPDVDRALSAIYAELGTEAAARSPLLLR